MTQRALRAQRFANTWREGHMKTVTLTAKQVLEATNALRQISQEENLRVPAKYAFRLGRILTVYVAETEELGKQQQKLQREYWKHDEGGNPVSDEFGLVQYEDREGYETQLQQLMDQEIELRFDGEIPLDELGKKFKPNVVDAAALEAAGIIDSGYEPGENGEKDEDEE